MVHHRYMFSKDPVIMQKGARLGLLKRDPMKEELLDRQSDPNRWIGGQRKAVELRMGEMHCLSHGSLGWLLEEAPSCPAPKRALPPPTTISISLSFSSNVLSPWVWSWKNQTCWLIIWGKRRSKEVGLSQPYLLPQTSPLLVSKLGEERSLKFSWAWSVDVMLEGYFNEWNKTVQLIERVQKTMGPAGEVGKDRSRGQAGRGHGKKRKVFLLPPSKTVGLLITDPYLLPKLSKKESTSSATFWQIIRYFESSQTRAPPHPS